VQFDLTVSGSTTAATSVAGFYAGNNFSSTNTTEANADVFARFTINTTTTDGNYVLRDITNATNSSTISGTARITWILNNSGSTMTYYAPDGSNASIANDKADIWAGTVQLFNDVNVQTGTQTITDLKFINNQGSQTIEIDNILVDPIPPVTVANIPTNVLSTSFTANWNAQSDVTGYRLDVSKNTDFSTFVSGYEGLLINGASATSAEVTGLQWGSMYHYRVRTSSSYSIGEFQSGHSNVAVIGTGVLDVNFTNVRLVNKQLTVLILFGVASELSIGSYALQRSDDCNNFKTIKTTLPRSNAGTMEEYQFEDLPGEHCCYRILAFETNGRMSYSTILSAKAPAPLIQVIARGLVVNTSTLQPGKYRFHIIDVNGRTVHMEEQIITSQKGSYRIELCNKPPGLYFIRIEGNGKNFSRAVVL
jgi:hypothetical protein